MSHIVLLVLSLLIYLFYKFIKKELYSLETLKNIILILSLITYLFVFLEGGWYRYHMSQIKTILIIVSLSILLYIYGLIENKEKVYNNNIKYYIILYLILLISITMFIYRGDIDFDFSNFKNFTIFNNIIPFDSINRYITHRVTFKTRLYHLGGNSIMLIPLSFLLMLKEDKYKKILNQLKILFPTIFLIELLQTYSGTGSFDIDDIILNIGGSIVFTFLITRFNIIDKIKKLFYKDFNLNIKLKYILFASTLIIPIYFLIDSIMITIKYLYI